MTNDSDSDGPSETEQWAILFNYFGKETLRELLFDVAASLENGDDRRVIEFRGDDAALDVTDHVKELESQPGQSGFSPTE